MDSPLSKEFEYFLAHQAELVEKHNGKYVVIRGQEVIGVYDDEKDAIAQTIKSFPLGTFLVQKVEPGTAAYTQTYNSRVEFA
jgi:hypothetical protein